MKQKIFKKIVCSLTSVALTFVMASPSLVSGADTITVAPENIINVQVTDKNGNPIDGIKASLYDSTNTKLTEWTTGSTSLSYIKSGSPISSITKGGTGSMTGANGVYKAYSSKTYTFQPIDFNKSGINIINVPTGDYTIKLNNVPAQYCTKNTSIKVVNSQNTQETKIVLDDFNSHSHYYSNSYTSDANYHWYECSCGNT